MNSQTLQDIISSINMERTRSKDSSKTQQTCLNNSTHQFYPQSNQPHISSNSFQNNNQQLNKTNPRRKSIRRRSCKRLKTPVNPQNKWTPQQQQQLFDLIGRYGNDFTFLAEYFPLKTNKQLKRKQKQLQTNKAYMKRIQKVEENIIRERKKSVFDEDIMDPNPFN